MMRILLSRENLSLNYIRITIDLDYPNQSNRVHPMNSMGSAVAKRAEKELGSPTLNIEVRQMDGDCMSQERFEKILSFFVDKCFDRAGKPRQ